MNNDIAITGLLSALAGMRNEELRQLAHLFRNPQAVASLAKLTESIVNVREVSGQVIDSARPFEQPIGGAPHSANKHDAKIVDEDPSANSRQKYALHRIIMDRKIFGSTHEALEFLNRVFALNLSYEDFKRSGRRDLFTKAWTSISHLSNAERSQRMSRAVKEMPSAASNSDRYLELFRILARNE